MKIKLKLPHPRKLGIHGDSSIEAERGDEIVKEANRVVGPIDKGNQ
jgi:hypothetical protein